MPKSKQYIVTGEYITLQTATADGYRIVGFYKGATVPDDVSDESIQHHLDSGLIEEASAAEETLKSDPGEMTDPTGSRDPGQGGVPTGAVTTAPAPAPTGEAPTASSTRAEINDYAVSVGYTQEEAEAFPNKEEALAAAEKRAASNS